MASKRKAVVHRAWETRPKTACGKWRALVERRSFKWDRTTCGTCLRKRPKPKGLRALILKK